MRRSLTYLALVLATLAVVAGATVTLVQTHHLTLSWDFTSNTTTSDAYGLTKPQADALPALPSYKPGTTVYFYDGKNLAGKCPVTHSEYLYIERKPVGSSLDTNIEAVPVCDGPWVDVMGKSHDSSPITTTSIQWLIKPPA